MYKYRLLECLAILLITFIVASAVHADSWRGRLKSGGVVKVDPYTHKPTVQYPGGSTQLWNGTHEMDDGSVIIVRDGVAVPDERMLNSWTGQAPAQVSDQSAHCEELVRKVCGFSGECSNSGPCATARQLQNLEQDELRQAPYGQVSASAVECEAGLADSALFPPCDAAFRAGNTACGRLVKRVCGAEKACAGAEDCRLAGQLLDMENEERMAAPDPNAKTETDRQCRQAMRNDTFKACAE